MTEKIIKHGDRTIIIKNLLDTKESWLDLLDSLTFPEAIAFGEALPEFMAKYPNTFKPI